jgi:hypothetical protein
MCHMRTNCIRTVLIEDQSIISGSSNNRSVPLQEGSERGPGAVQSHARELKPTGNTGMMALRSASPIHSFFIHANPPSYTPATHSHSLLCAFAAAIRARALPHTHACSKMRVPASQEYATTQGITVDRSICNCNDGALAS